MKHRLFSTETGLEVKPGAFFDRGEEAYELVGFTAPRHSGSTGRVQVKHLSTGMQREFYPSVFDLTIVEAKSDKFDN